MSSYTDISAKSESKAEFRKIIYESLKNIITTKSNVVLPKSRENARLLTLCANNYDLERKVARFLKIRVDVVEIDKATYHRQQVDSESFKDEERDNIYFYHTSLSKHLSKAANKYTVIYADFCGHMSEEILMCLSCLQQHTEHLYITFKNTPRCNAFPSIRTLAEKYFKAAGKTNFTHIDYYRYVLYFFGFEVTGYTEYQSNRSPMTFFEAKRILISQ